MKNIITNGLKLVLFTMLTSKIFAQAPVLTFNPISDTFLQGTSAIFSPIRTGGTIPNIYFSGVSTFAGNSSGTSGSSNGTGTSASLFNPNSIAMDTSGNFYVADAGNNLIRKITSAGVVTTLAGSGFAGYVEGTGTAAYFNNPTGIVVDAAGVNLYVADCNNNRIRKIVILTGVTSFVAGSGTAGNSDGLGIAASFSYPTSIAINPTTGNLYVSDLINCRIRQVTPAGLVSSFAGSGKPGSFDSTGINSSFLLSKGVLAADATNLYLADWGNHRIRKIVIASGVTTTIAGGVQGYKDSVGTFARFNHPSGIISDGTYLYVADEGNNRIRKIVISNGTVSTIAGSGMAGLVNSNFGLNAAFNGPKGIAYDKKGHLFVADAINNVIRSINIFGYNYTPTSLPAGITFDSTGSFGGIATTQQSASPYIVTGVNALGSDTANVKLSVKQNPPIITSFSPLAAANGNMVTIKGTKFTYASTVSFGGVAATSFTVYGDTMVKAVVGVGSTGNISISTPGGTGTISGFTFIPVPVIYSVQPLTAACGQNVFITGVNFIGSNYTTTNVTFGGLAASAFQPSNGLNGSTVVNAKVGNDTSGLIAITTGGGTASTPGFTYIPWSITSFTPTNTFMGNTITITGQNFQNGDTVKTVYIGGVAATSFQIVSNSSITAVVPTGATSGSIVLTNTNGCTISKTGFVYNSSEYDFGAAITSDKNGKLYFGNGYNNGNFGILQMTTSTGAINTYLNSLANIGNCVYDGSYLYGIDLSSPTIWRMDPSNSMAMTQMNVNGVNIITGIANTGNPQNFYVIGTTDYSNFNIYSIGVPLNGSDFTATKLTNTALPLYNYSTEGNSIIYNNGFVYYVSRSGIQKIATTGTRKGIVDTINNSITTGADITTDGQYLYVIGGSTGFTVYKIPIDTPTTYTTLSTDNTSFSPYAVNGLPFFAITYDGAGHLYMTDSYHVYSININTSAKTTIFSANSTSNATTNEPSSVLNLKVYPNPSTGTANLQVSGLDASATAAVEITNVGGNNVWNKSSVTNSTIELPSSELPAGLYFITIKNKTESKATRWIKSK